jgi:ABC-type Zn uptake system ZnuABC Zn-binding protein ZnuA
MFRCLRSGASRASLLLLVFASLPAGADALRVVTTTPDLADLARAVGGDGVEVTSLARGPQDVHFIEARPSFLSALHRADALVLVGMDLEIGWLPALLRSARNPDVAPGGRGSIDASRVIEPLEVPTTRIDRSMGDIHPYGNPHYLVDPLNGLAVAALLRERFAALRPDRQQDFEAREAALAKRILEALVGPTLAGSADRDALVAKLRSGALADAPELGGWLGRARAAGVSRAVQDHRYWAYFARRFGLELVDTLEPQPGIAPTTAHLREVIERIRAEHIPVVLTNPYFDPRHARFVSEQTGARIARMAHQVGATPGATDYVATVAHNVREVFGE